MLFFRLLTRGGDVDHPHRARLARLAGVYYQRNGLRRDHRAVRLAFRIEAVAAGAAHGLPGFVGAAAFQRKYVLVRQRDRDDLDEFPCPDVTRSIAEGDTMANRC